MKVAQVLFLITIALTVDLCAQVTLPANSSQAEPSRAEIPKGTFLWSKKSISTGHDAGDLEGFVNRAVLYGGEIEEVNDEPEVPVYDGPAYIESDDRDEPEDDLQKPVEVLQTQADSDVPESSGPQVQEEGPDDGVDLRFTWTDKRFADAIDTRAGARGVMIYYADDTFYDIARLHAFVEEGRDLITSAGNIDADRIEVIFGGFRADPQVEYWIVPPGGKSPQPTPQER